MNNNHEQSVGLKLDDYASQKSIDKMADRVLKYLRDVRAPDGKRTFGHLLSRFSDEGRKIENMIVVDAIDQLIEKGVLSCQRGGVVGTNKGWACRDREWIIYSKGISKRKIQHLPKKTPVPNPPHNFSVRCRESKPYMCVDVQCIQSAPDGKWTKGERRKRRALDFVTPDGDLPFEEETVPRKVRLRDEPSPPPLEETVQKVKRHRRGKWAKVKDRDSRKLE